MKKFALAVSLGAVIFFIAPSLAEGQVFGDIRRVVFPQFVFGGGWSTTVVVTNISTVPAQFTIGLTIAGSDELVPITRRNGEVIMVGAYNPGDISPQGSWTNTFKSDSQDVKTGYISVMVRLIGGQDTVKVQVTYSYAPNGILESQALVPATMPVLLSRLQVARSGAHEDIGIAMVNLKFEPANVSVKAYNMAGQEVGITRLVVKPGHQVGKFITEIMPDLKNNWTGGLIEVTSDKEVATMGLVTSVGSDGRFIFSTASTF